MKNQEEFDNKIEKEILLVLWQASLFNDRCYEVLENFVKNADKNIKNNKKPPSLLFSKDAQYALATARNHNLINANEQDKLQNTIVGFFGLSVGSHAAITWIQESRANIIKIADYDNIDPTNLNRLRAGWDEIGINKTVSLTEKLIEIHPYIQVFSSTARYKKAMIKFCEEKPHLSIIVDAIDDIEGKIQLRKFAKEKKIALISGADVGDNVVLDIERYDKTPQPPLFLGRLPNIEKIKFSTLSELERKKLIIKLVGFEENSEQLLDSLLALGKSLGTWPQLGATAAITGGAIATTIKKIVLGEDVQSGRYYFSLDNILVNNYKTKYRKNNREEKIKRIKERFKIFE